MNPRPILTALSALAAAGALSACQSTGYGQAGYTPDDTKLNAACDAGPTPEGTVSGAHCTPGSSTGTPSGSDANVSGAASAGSAPDDSGQ